MLIDITLLTSAFLMGLYGSTHCVGMCGPVITILGVNTQYKQVPSAVFYNLGRITTYTLLGLIAGLLTMAMKDFKPVQLVLRYLAAVIMIFVALQLFGLPQFLGFIERPLQIIWKPLSKISKKFFPIKSALGAYLTGIIWGFLPCGMVYGAFAMSMGGGGLLNAMLVMLAFGLGTLPMMLSLGVFGNYIGKYLQHKNARYIAGTLILVMTAYYLLTTGGGHKKPEHNQPMVEMPMESKGAAPMKHAH